MLDAPDHRILPPLTVLACVQATAEIVALSLDDILSYRRGPAPARHMAMYLATRHTSASLSVIGRSVGGRTAATVQMAIGRVQERLLDEPDFRATVEHLDAILLGMRHAGAPKLLTQELADPIKIAVDFLEAGRRANPTHQQVTALALFVVQRALEAGTVKIEIDGEELEPDEPPPAPPPAIVSHPSPRLAQAIERAISAHCRLSDAKFTRDEKTATEALSAALNTLQTTFKADLAQP